jgi:hypothetical protein
MADKIDTLEVISRQEAIARNLPYYYSKNPCKRNHFALRRVDSCSCSACDIEGRTANKERIKEAQIRWRQKHPGLAAKRASVWFNLHKDKAKITQKIYYKINREDIIKKNADWSKNNLDKVRTYHKMWARNNPEKAKASSHRKRAAKLKCQNNFTPKDVLRILHSQKNKCAYCKKRLTVYHIDHINPLIKGGTNEARNIQLLCQSCNCSKGARDPIYHAQTLGMLL